MYLVTGCAGFIGFSVCLSLLKKNKKVIGVDSLNFYYSKGYKLNRLSILKKYSTFEFKLLDICENLKLRNLFSKYEITKVIHLAAQPGVVYSYKNPMSYNYNNTLATKSLINVIKIYKPKKFIFSSSSSVYGDQKKFPINENFKLKPKNFYAKTKVQCEKMIKKELNKLNISTIIVRPFTVYGPYGRPDMLILKMLNLIFKSKTINIYNYGKHLRDFTYIDDLVKIINILLNTNFNKIETFNICASKPIKILKVLELTKKNLNKEFSIKYCKKRKGEMNITYGSNKKLIKKINYKKFISVEKGIKKTIQWYKSFPKKKLFETYK